MAELFPERPVRAKVREFVAAAERHFVELKTRTRDGRVIDAAWAALRLSDGTTIAIGEDLSERRKLEQQLWQSQKLEAVGRLAGGIAHDFNNVLNVVMGYTELLARPLPRRARAQETRQILTAAQRPQPHPPASRLQPPTGASASRARSRGRGRGHRRHASPVGGTSRSDASHRHGARPRRPGQWQRFCPDLAVNARDAMPTGGGLTIETRTWTSTISMPALHPR
jgi:hypothetical protein